MPQSEVRDARNSHLPRAIRSRLHTMLNTQIHLYRMPKGILHNMRHVEEGLIPVMHAPWLTVTLVAVSAICLFSADAAAENNSRPELTTIAAEPTLSVVTLN